MAALGGPDIVTDGLILVLDATNPLSYPGSGTTWYDLSGNGNHSTINSGEFVSSPFSGYLRNVNNESNFFYITIPNSTSISNTLSVTSGGWTIEEIIWTNSTNYPEADAGSVFSNPAYGPSATGFDWNHGVGINQFQFGQSSNFCSPSPWGQPWPGPTPSTSSAHALDSASPHPPQMYRQQHPARYPHPRGRLDLRPVHDDLTTARAFGLAARVADLEDQLAKLRHYHFSTLLTLATMAGGEIRVGKFDYQATRGLALAMFVDPKTGDRVFVAKEAAGDQPSPQAV